MIIVEVNGVLNLAGGFGFSHNFSSSAGLVNLMGAGGGGEGRGN